MTGEEAYIIQFSGSDQTRFEVGLIHFFVYPKLDLNNLRGESNQIELKIQA